MWLSDWDLLCLFQVWTLKPLRHRISQPAARKGGARRVQGTIYKNDSLLNFPRILQVDTYKIKLHQSLCLYTNHTTNSWSCSCHKSWQYSRLKNASSAILHQRAKNEFFSHDCWLKAMWWPRHKTQYSPRLLTTISLPATNVDSTIILLCFKIKQYHLVVFWNKTTSYCCVSKQNMLTLCCKNKTKSCCVSR